jgi:hypothetical protein
MTRSIRICVAVLAVSLMTHASAEDVLSSDGANIFMRHRRYDKNCAPQRGGGAKHLFCSVGFLDDSWWHRTYWMMGGKMSSGWGSWPKAGNQVPAGRILAAGRRQRAPMGRLDAGWRKDQGLRSLIRPGLRRHGRRLRSAVHIPEERKRSLHPVAVGVLVYSRCVTVRYSLNVSMFRLKTALEM